MAIMAKQAVCLLCCVAFFGVDASSVDSSPFKHHFSEFSTNASLGSGISWPQSEKAYSQRPPTGAPYCKAGVIPFCPTGLPASTMPTVKPNDTLIVYALKAPIWEFKFGDLLADFHLMHDAVGFHHVESGLNITMEWYELFQLFNCTMPHMPKPTELKWCNQGATCIYMGIDEKHWRQNGTLAEVARINGTIFNNFANWVELDNNTFPFYETWTVKNANGSVWFEPFDCASWVIRAFDKMHFYGATFNQSVQLNYTKINLISSEPKFLVAESDLYKVHNLPTLLRLAAFYTHFQANPDYRVMIENLFKYIESFLLDNSFFLYYNQGYYQLPLVEPFIKLTYENIPLPK